MNTNTLLQGKIALVTGGSRGIGMGIARKLASQGADIAFTYKSSQQSALELEKELQAMGVRARAYASDAADYAQAEKLIEQILADFGGLEIIVNNAGITRDQLLIRMTEEQWDQVMDNNLKSVFNVCKHAVRHLMKNRKGSIINMSSIVGMKGNAGQSSYAASKAGIIGFTKSIAQELGSRNVRVNAIAPGFIETDMTHYLKDGGAEKWFEKIPMARFGKPEEVADVALFLASDMSSYVSGQVISVCGAMNT